MSQPLAHLYDLALRALDEQERRAEALRARLGPVLAAAALGASLLGGPLASDAHPSGIAGNLAMAVALGGLLVTVGVTLRLLASHLELVTSLDLRDLITELGRAGLLHDETAFYATMIARLGDQAKHNARVIERLATTFTAMLWGILVMLCGLAFSAIVG